MITSKETIRRKPIETPQDISAYALREPVKKKAKVNIPNTLKILSVHQFSNTYHSLPERRTTVDIKSTLA